MSKKTFAIFILINLLILVVGTFALAKDLEVDYPNIGDKTPAPTNTEAKLTDYIRYIFALSIRIAGFIALGVMIYGGIKWLVSGGSPGKIVDARSQILGGFLGIIILLSSYLILRTINPVLVSTTLYKEPTADCSKCSFDQDTGEIDDCDGNEKWQDFCKLELDHYKYPGVYLIGTSEDTQRVLLNSSILELTSLTNEVNPDETLDLNDKVTGIRFGRNNDDAEEQYCAILHEDKNYEGAARIICQETSGGPIYNAIGSDNLTGTITGVSSITIFQLNPEAEGGVTIFNAPGWKGDDWFFDVPERETYWSTDFSHTADTWPNGTEMRRHVYSLQINGSVLVMLCGENFKTQGVTSGGACLPFLNSVEDLSKTNMGACDPLFPEEIPLFVVPESCVENIHIFKVKF